MDQHIVQKPSDVYCLTVSDSAVMLPTPDTDVVGGVLVVEEGDVRMRWDGVDPSPGVGGGFPLPALGVWEFIGRDYFTAMKFIRETGSDGYVTVAYSRGE